MGFMKDGSRPSRWRDDQWDNDEPVLIDDAGLVLTENLLKLIREVGVANFAAAVTRALIHQQSRVRIHTTGPYIGHPTTDLGWAAETIKRTEQWAEHICPFWPTVTYNWGPRITKDKEA